MNYMTSISVSDLIGTSVHTREASSIIMQAIKDCPSNEVEIDFSLVDYISRSFADQFHSDRIQVTAELKKFIVISNANDEVINMLEAVAKTQHKVHRNMTRVPVYNFSSQEQLERYLLRF